MPRASIRKTTEKIGVAMSLDLTVVAKGTTENNRTLEKGDVVKYRCHLPGGNVRIEHADGTTDVANPNCFKELR